MLRRAGQQLLTRGRENDYHRVMAESLDWLGLSAFPGSPVVFTGI
jgi:hypothetical protein